MTETPPATGSLLYSQTSFDERGNFHYQGDLHRPAEQLSSIASRIQAHLAAHFTSVAFAIRTKKFAGGRKIIAEILDAPQDLTGRDGQEAFIVAVRDQMERFSFTNSNLYQDMHNCAFFCDVRIGQSYWSALAARRGMKNPVEQRLSLAAFKKQVKPGDCLKLLGARQRHRALGTTRVITKVRSGDLILEGRSYLTFPRASAFACDGRLVRISIGSEYDPDEHLLYEWIPQMAA